MGAHADRKSARQTTVARLQAVTAVTDIVPAGSIYDSRTTTVISTGSLPMINVYTPVTEARRKGAPIMFTESHDLVVECFEVQASTGDAGADDAALAAKVDDLAEVVQNALFTDPGTSPPAAIALGWLYQFEAVDVVRSEIVLDGTSDGRRGLCRMMFEVKHTAQYDPTPLDDLTDISIDLDLIEDGEAPDGDVDAELDITDLDA